MQNYLKAEASVCFYTCVIICFQLQVSKEFFKLHCGVFICVGLDKRSVATSWSCDGPLGEKQWYWPRFISGMLFSARSLNQAQFGSKCTGSAAFADTGGAAHPSLSTRTSFILKKQCRGHCGMWVDHQTETAWERPNPITSIQLAKGSNTPRASHSRSGWSMRSKHQKPVYRL